MPVKNIFLYKKWLLPFSWIYGIGVNFRNRLFDWGILKSESFPLPVICVGNLTVGGTGKTPHTEYIVNLLRSRHQRVAILSRGYKRKTKGYILADDRHTSRDIGDEPFQMKSKFPDVIVAVDADRRHGIRQLLALPKDRRPEVIILDDAFQHRYVHPSLSIVLNHYNEPIYDDDLLPAGRLREPASQINRADIVIVTKCPGELKPIDYRIIEDGMHLQAHQIIFFTSIAYGDLVPLFKEAAPCRLDKGRKKEEILLVTGIASPESLISEIQLYAGQLKTMIYPDHHNFNSSDLKDIHSRFSRIKAKDKIIIVTEKDAARLRSMSKIPADLKKALYYIPIRIRFHNQANFDEIINKHIAQFNNKSIYE